MARRSPGRKKPGNESAGSSRPPLQRMLRIHQPIQAGKNPNATKLAKELEVSTKSVHRDLDFMQDRLELPLEWNAGRKQNL